MKFAALVVSLLAGLLLSSPGQARNDTYSSSEHRNALIELYTSEGCSSCPPADRWLSRLKRDPRLWKELYPVAFHVDYWNYLGWQDVFSKPAFSMRQRSYAAHHYVSTVYTPGFVLNGREWRGWFRSPTLVLGKAIKTGKLTATVTDGHINATFIPTGKVEATHLNVALLASNQSNHIHAGENRGKQLHHDFVAITHQQYKSGTNRWQVSDKALLRQLPDAKAIVLWLTHGTDPTPIQTTGGWLSTDDPVD